MWCSERWKMLLKWSPIKGTWEDRVWAKGQRFRLYNRGGIRRWRATNFGCEKISSRNKEDRKVVVGKSIQYRMTLSHSKGDSTSATIKAKLFEITSLWDVRERRKRSTNRGLPLMIDPIFSLCCLLPAPCSFTGPATPRSCKMAREGNYKKHTFIIDSRIRINQIHKHNNTLLKHMHIEEPQMLY